MPPYVVSTQFVLPVRVLRVEIFFDTSEVELGISFWTWHDFSLAKGTNSFGCLCFSLNGDFSILRTQRQLLVTPWSVRLSMSQG